jgi:hypothetical protein
MRNAHVLIAAIALTLTACDDTTTGQQADDPSPPRLQRVMFQSGANTGAYGKATDLLDVHAPIVCSCTNPCQTPYVLTDIITCVYPDGVVTTCEDKPTDTQGVCPDPIEAGPVPAGAPGGAAVALQIRFVTNKILNPAVETDAVAADGTVTATLNPDPTHPMLKLVDASGADVTGPTYYDPTGSPDTTSLLEIDPFGPALVMRPGYLSPNSSYTLILDPTQVVDKNQQGLRAANAAALPVPYALPFTVEDLALDFVTPDLTMTSTVVAPNQFLQLTFNAGVALASASITLTHGGITEPIIVFNDPDPDGNGAPNAIVDIVPGSGCTPSDLPSGSYTLRVSGLKDGARGEATPYAQTFTFNVGGAPVDASDPTASTSVTPPACVASTTN